MLFLDRSKSARLEAGARAYVQASPARSHSVNDRFFPGHAPVTLFSQRQILESEGKRLCTALQHNQAAFEDVNNSLIGRLIAWVGGGLTFIAAVGLGSAIALNPIALHAVTNPYILASILLGSFLVTVALGTLGLFTRRKDISGLKKLHIQQCQEAKSVSQRLRVINKEEGIKTSRKSSHLERLAGDKGPSFGRDFGLSIQNTFVGFFGIPIGLLCLVAGGQPHL